MNKPPRIPDEPTPIPDSAPGEYTSYDQVPSLRKSGVNTGLILASFLSCGLFPGTIIVCFVVLTGEVYFNNQDERGYLKKWHWTNKVVAVFLLLLNLGRLVQLASALQQQ